MKKAISSLLAGALWSCSADPGYEPRHEPRESQPYVTEDRLKPAPSLEAPRKTLGALQVCADRYAVRLSGKSDSYAVMVDLEVAGDGATAKVKDSMIPGTELETCLTNVLERMDIPDSVARTSPQSRSMVGVVQAVAAPIALAPIVLVAGGVTILVGVTIYVAAGTLDATRVERCKLACDVVNRLCIARCTPRNNKECMNRCNQDTAACYRDCER